VTANFFSPHQNGFVIALMVSMAWACGQPNRELTPYNPGGNIKSVLVANHGWHSAIVIKNGDIAEAELPEIKYFSETEFFEFGWGDRDYYQAPDPGLGLALMAVFWSSGSVLHVAGIKGDVKSYFPNSKLTKIILSDEAFQLLIRFISDTIVRTEGRALVETRPGLYPNSRFYPARGKFHLFRTCNTWVAEALLSAGLPLNPAMAFTAGNLSRQIRGLSHAVEDASEISP
jgi:uncharacterized protein (TIGR02117 family)